MTSTTGVSQPGVAGMVAPTSRTANSSVKAEPVPAPRLSAFDRANTPAPFTPPGPYPSTPDQWTNTRWDLIRFNYPYNGTSPATSDYAQVIPTDGALLKNVGNDWSKAIETARDRSRAHPQTAAQAIFQAQDGALYVGSLGRYLDDQRTKAVVHSIDGASVTKHYNELEVGRFNKHVQAVVGAGHIIDYAGRGVPAQLGLSSVQISAA